MDYVFGRSQVQLRGQTQYLRSKKRREKIKFNQILEDIIGCNCNHCLKCQKKRQYIQQRISTTSSLIDLKKIDWVRKQQEDYQHFIHQILGRNSSRVVSQILQHPFYYIKADLLQHKYVTRMLQDRNSIKDKLQNKNIRKLSPFNLSTNSFNRNKRINKKHYNTTIYKSNLQFDNSYKEVDQEIKQQLRNQRQLKRIKMMKQLQEKMKNAQDKKSVLKVQMQKRLRKKAQADKQKKKQLAQRKQIDKLSQSFFNTVMKNKFKFSVNNFFKIK